MTRAGKALQFSFAATRTRNGKHESNSPSRFIREVDSKYISNPITEDEVDDKPVQEKSFGGWGKWNSYGRSGPAVSQRPVSAVQRPASLVQRPIPGAQRPVSGRPESIRHAEPTVVRRVQPVAPRVPDSEFVPTPVLQLRAGQRIEHNRFGFGRIVEISGNPADLKAKISFDEHGEKILILKYAKIRVV